MEIVELEIRVERREPNPQPIRDALQSLPGAGGVEVVLRTEDGIEGRGRAFFGRIQGGPETLAALIEKELKPLVVGSDPAFVRRTHAALLRETEYHGYRGLTMFGVAAIDTALWDCLGKAHGVPCWQLWGGVRERIPAYAMVGWLNYDDGQVQEICAKAVEKGFRAVKIKVGFPTLAEDIRRVELVRRAVGDDVVLMVDANQSLTLAEAVQRGRAFERMGCHWWEEPLPADDLEGYAHLARALDIPVATGENLYTKEEFARFLKREAVDVAQADLRRAGGPTSLLQIGTMADAFRVPYASHGGDPVQVNVMACLPNAVYLETGMDLPAPLEDGCVAIPRGVGFSWE